jgi:hypothetical protein
MTSQTSTHTSKPFSLRRENTPPCGNHNSAMLKPDEPGVSSIVRITVGVMSG